MSDEIHHQRQCQTCSKCFPSNADLWAHIEKYRSKERILLSAVAKCRVHANDLIEKSDMACEQNDDNEDGNDNACENKEDCREVLCLPKTNGHPRSFNCPHKDCKRTQPFLKMKGLRRHFAMHVRCEEVCVYCFRVFTFASQYIAHAGSHKDANATKDSFISRICDGLRKRVNDELCSSQSRGLDLANGNESSAQKRSSEVANLGSMIPEVQISPRPDPYGINEAITNAIPFHDVIDTGPHCQLPIPAQPVTALTSLANNEEPLAINDGFADVSEPALNPNLPILNEPYEEYSAPVFWSMTFPPTHMAQQYHEGSNEMHTSIMTSSLHSTSDRTQSMQTQIMQENSSIDIEYASATYQDP